jgi:hypothetical protein
MPFSSEGQNAWISQKGDMGIDIKTGVWDQRVSSKWPVSFNWVANRIKLYSFFANQEGIIRVGRFGNDTVIVEEEMRAARMDPTGEDEMECTMRVQNRREERRTRFMESIR